MVSVALSSCCTLVQHVPGTLDLACAVRRPADVCSAVHTNLTWLYLSNGKTCVAGPDIRAATLNYRCLSIRTRPVGRDLLVMRSGRTGWPLLAIRDVLNVRVTVQNVGWVPIMYYPRIVFVILIPLDSLVLTCGHI